MKSYWRSIFCICLLSAALFSCRQIDVYEQNKVITAHQWKRSEPVKGSFLITDTQSVYNIYIVLRHTDSYEYNNIWLNIGLQAPEDTMAFQKVDLSLGNDMYGWEGAGMNDIFEVRKMISGRPRKFRKPGKYQFEIGQIMRNDPLLHVLNAGLRVEKVYQP